MDRHGITTTVGADRIFATLHEAIALTRRESPAGEPPA
jgi:hypothetical protein